MNKEQEARLRYLQDPQYLQQRKSSLKELMELIIPLGAVALTGMGLYKGVKWAKNIAPLEAEKVRTIKDILEHTSSMGGKAKYDIPYNLAKYINRSAPLR